MDFTGKRVLVTGSSRGIGQAAARAFHEAGAIVAINGRTTASSEAGIASLGGGDRLVAAPGDVASVAGCEAIVAAAAAAMGGIDVLVNSAGVGDSASLEETTEAMWDAAVDINLKGTFFCCQAALPHLRAARGNIVNLASDAGLIGEVGLSAYCASKGGVVNLTRALALELAPDIRVNSVCPGYVDTDMVRRDGIEKADNPAAAEAALIDYAPLKRIAQPWEIGAAIAYLASEASVFVTGIALPVDGGTTAGNSGG
ncbi:MAG: SDR family oxidoreductase [Alphaproteobacteria bacterium]|jgi:NAD(P)-dependent dehydrogenase (short-subunit alcohol dehydrogenase family)|nr:SDR family oxidoreductase [Rhodospirillaceae bacterium]MBT6509992.1 SDR family oxidoreductase [Rhodospirillaceae bacterium]MDG2479308.1 SDR family oxidoreductase [Alphaproteobacteria bacterium]